MTGGFNKKLVNQGMILGYSYRYYDDDVADEKPERRSLLIPGAGA